MREEEKKIKLRMHEMDGGSRRKKQSAHTFFDISTDISQMGAMNLHAIFTATSG